MNDDLKAMLEAFRSGQEDQASAILREFLGKRMNAILHEGEEVFAEEPKSLSQVIENFGNLITRAIPGAPDGGAVIPNVYTTKKIPKKKKKLPSLKKSVYGTGYAPLSSQPAGEGGSCGGGGGGGGDAGGGGDGGGGGGGE